MSRLERKVVVALMIQPTKNNLFQIVSGNFAINPES